MTDQGRVDQRQVIRAAPGEGTALAGEVVVALVGRPLDDVAIDVLWSVVRDGGMVDDVIAAADAQGITDVAALDRGPTRRLVVRGTVRSEPLPGDAAPGCTGLRLRLATADPTVAAAEPAVLALDRGLVAADAIELDAWSAGSATGGGLPAPAAGIDGGVDGGVDGEVDGEVDGDTVLVARPLPVPPASSSAAVAEPEEEVEPAAVLDATAGRDRDLVEDEAAGDDELVGDTVLAARPLLPPAPPEVEVETGSEAVDDQALELAEPYGPETSPDAVNASRPRKPAGIRSLVEVADDGADLEGQVLPPPPPHVHVDAPAPPAPPPLTTPDWAVPAPSARPAATVEPPGPPPPAPPTLNPRFDPDGLRLPDARPGGLTPVITDVPRPVEPGFPLGVPGAGHGAPHPGAGADHDGTTVSAAEVRALAGAPSDPAATPMAAVPTTGPAHLAAQCPAGHLNPPHADRCRVCGSAVPIQTPFAVPAIDLGVFRFSTGLVKPLVRSMVIGRAPKLSGGFRGPVPELVTVPSPEQDISRTHVEVLVEGWQVLVVDRGSTNGTTVTIPGHGTQRLRPDLPFPLPPGAVLSLADEVSIAFEVPR